LHPEYVTTTLGDYYDPNDPSPLPAGQAGSGYKWWGTPSSAKSANGTQGTTEARGVYGAKVGDSGAGGSVVAGLGHFGGSVIYYDSDVASPTTGTHITLYNKGWMSAGCGGGSGSATYFAGAGSYPSGHGGAWDTSLFPSESDAEHWRGVGGFGRLQSGGLVTGGGPGQLFQKAVGTNLLISNNVINNSGNNIYGWDETWPPL
jgi:hypothetical protein